MMAEEEVPMKAAITSTAELATDGDNVDFPADGLIENSSEVAADVTSSSYALSSTVSRNHSIMISFVILLAHGLFLWGQLDLLWAQYVSYSASASFSVDNITSTFIADRTNITSIDTIQGNTNDPYLVGEWSYGGMLSELWIYSKVTAVVLFVFSAFWPHLKLVLLHVYFYRPVPSKPRRAALYWLDAVGKMSLADVCATCMIFLLLNFQATIQLGDITSQLSDGLLANVGLYIAAQIPNGTLSYETQKILDDITVLAFDEVVNLSQSIFNSDGDPEMYMALLEEGCAKFRNGGTSCSGTSFYEPTSISSEAQIVTKCLPIRNECRQCECLVNEIIYNKLIPGQVVEERIGDAVSWTFAKLLAFIKAGNDDFATWFSAEGQFKMQSEVFAYPAFIGFTIAVIVSICASLLVDEVEMKDSMKRLNGGATTLSEALDNSGVDKGTRSLLFGFNEEGSVKKWTSRIPILAGLCIVPIVFLAIHVKMFNWTTEGLLEQLLFMQTSTIHFYYSIIDCVQKVNNGTGYGWAFTVLYVS